MIPNTVDRTTILETYQSRCFFWNQPGHTRVVATNSPYFCFLKSIDHYGLLFRWRLLE